MSDTSPAVKKETTADEAALLPPVDVVEDASGITLYADLPGVPKEKLNLHVEADTLTIEGEIDLEMPGRSQPAALPSGVHPVQGTRREQGQRRVQERRT